MGYNVSMNRRNTVVVVRAYLTLVGTVIGAGIFGVPYVYSKIGLLLGVTLTVILGGFLTLLLLLYAELLLRARRSMRLPGIADKFLGRRAAGVATVSTVIGFWASLLAYLIIGGSFLDVLFGRFTGWPLIYWQLLFYLVSGIVVISGLWAVARAEFWLTGILLLVLVYFVGRLLPGVDFSYNFSADARQTVLGYGVILFALAGTGAVPAVRELLVRREKRLYQIIALGGLTTALMTGLFGLAVVGITGAGTTEQAIDGLVSFLGENILLLGVTLGLLAVVTSFFTNGLYLLDTFRLDFRRSRPLAAVLALAPPLFAFFLGAQRFIAVIGFAGAVLGAFDSIIICLAYRAAQKQKQPVRWPLKVPGWLVWGLLTIFSLGVLATIFQVLFWR
ncbi:hypothetical protein EPN90_01535 [Patescibacteria group bacterium]|nr:MAG: hypothetical protein EPN90_01535 [Patescibacteria group bacterium]